MWKVCVLRRCLVFIFPNPQWIRRDTKLFVKILLGFESLAIFTKSCILDVWHGSEYVSVNDVIWSQRTIKNGKLSKKQYQNPQLVSYLAMISLLKKSRNFWFILQANEDQFSLRCLCFSEKFTHHKIRWNYVIIPSVWFISPLPHNWHLSRCKLNCHSCYSKHPEITMPVQNENL